MMARVSEKAPGHRSRGFARKNKIRSSSIQTVTVGTGVTPVQPPPKAAGRGLYRQWELRPALKIFDMLIFLQTLL